MIPGRRDPEGRLYLTADPPDATSSFNGGIAVRPDGVVHALLDSTDVDPHNVAPPVISGTGVLGDVLTALPGMWTGTPTPTVTGQWMEFGHPIPGATGLTFTPTVQQENGTVTYRETAVNTGATVQATSNGIRIERVPVEGIGFDNYSTNFARGYWLAADHPSMDLLDGNYHYLKPAIATVAGPGGVTVPDTAALAALGGAAWFDNNGTLGKFKVEAGGAEITAAEMAAAIDANAIIEVKYVAPDILVKASYNG